MDIIVRKNGNATGGKSKYEVVAKVSKSVCVSLHGSLPSRATANALKRNINKLLTAIAVCETN